MTGAVTFQDLRGRLRDLLRPAVIGDFDHLEVVEVVGTPPDGPTCNVLTVAVLAEGDASVGSAERSRFLTGRIAVDGMRGWSFGVVQTFRPVSALDEALADQDATGVWALSGRALAMGRLEPQPGMFAPPDGTADVPLNRVLKNNFWAGSHVFRLCDLAKARFGPLLEDRRRLQALSDAVSDVVPMAFAGLADLLGDVLVQVPVTILAPRIRAPRGAVHTDVQVAWRDGAASRQLSAAARARWDGVLTGAAVGQRFEDAVRLPLDAHGQPLEAELWDAATGLLVAASSATSTLKRIQLNISVAAPEPRLFTTCDAAGQPVEGRVELVSTHAGLVGEEAGRDVAFWFARRQQLEEGRRLAESRDFVQYRPEAGSLSERRRALEDVRMLVDRHGAEGVDLWDPYLTGEDLLQTLFWSRHAGQPLRALTDGRDTPAAARDSTVAPVAFAAREQGVLERDKGNCEGLSLEYRTRRGPKGWSFHDRFLIFPNGGGGPLAWSLGTSVNSLGKAHHILQRVSNGALVAGAFQDLWVALDEEQHVIWRSW